MAPWCNVTLARVQSEATCNSSRFKLAHSYGVPLLQIRAFQVDMPDQRPLSVTNPIGDRYLGRGRFVKLD